MKLWEYKWFVNLVTYFNEHWSWWKKYIYGESKSMEDFVRNPAEVFRDNCFPFCIKDINPISLINLRILYKQFDPSVDYVGDVKKEDSIDVSSGTYWLVPMGNNKLVLKKNSWTFIDVRVFNKFWTKFCNSLIFFQLTFSMKYKFIPIPHIALCIRFSKTSYFQFGFGWGPQFKPGSSTEYNTILCAKFLVAIFKDEVQWNPSDVYGFYEGTI